MKIIRNIWIIISNIFLNQIAGSNKSTISSGTLSNLLQNGKNSVALTSGGPSSVRVSPASSILLTTTNSAADNMTTSTSTTSKGRLLLSSKLLNNLSGT